MILYVYLPYIWINIMWQDSCSPKKDPWLHNLLAQVFNAGIGIELQKNNKRKYCTVEMNYKTLGKGKSLPPETINPSVVQVEVANNYIKSCLYPGEKSETCKIIGFRDYVNRKIESPPNHLYIAFTYDINYTLTKVPYVHGNRQTYYKFSNEGYISKLMLQILEHLQCGIGCYYGVDYGKVFTSFMVPLLAVENPATYSPAISARSVLFYVRAPKPLDKLYAYAAPFELLLWLALGATIILLSVLIFIIGYSEARIRRVKYPSVLDSFFYLIESGLRQDLDTEALPGSAVKFSFLVWITVIFVVTASYSGAILSYLSVPLYEPVIETFNDLADAIQQGKYSCGTDRSYAIRSMLNASKTGVWKILRDSMERDDEKNLVDNVEDGLKMALERNYAFISYDLFTNPVLMELGESNFFVSKDSLFTSYSASAFYEGFHYQNEFENLMMRFQEAGIINKFYDDIILDLKRKKAFYAPVESDEYRPLVLGDFDAPLFLLIAGCVLSILTFLIEIVVNKVCNSKIRQ